MHHIVTVVTKQNVPALDNFVSQARDMYNDNLDLYIKLVLRRPLAKLLVSRLDFLPIFIGANFFFGFTGFLPRP